MVPPVRVVAAAVAVTVTVESSNFARQFAYSGEYGFFGADGIGVPAAQFFASLRHEPRSQTPSLSRVSRGTGRSPRMGTKRDRCFDRSRRDLGRDLGARNL